MLIDGARFALALNLLVLTCGLNDTTAINISASPYRRTSASVSLPLKTYAHDGGDHGGLDKQFYTNIHVGTPPRNFRVCVDTGSGNLILPGSQCDSTACLDHKRYDWSRSMTSEVNECETVRNDGKAMVHYSGGRILGDCVRDKVCIGEVCTMAPFISTSFESSNTFGEAAFDGVLGLSLPELARGNGEFSIFDHLKEHFQNPIFSVFLSDDDVSSEITFGGANPRHMASEIFWVDTVTGPGTSGYWQVLADDITIDTIPQQLCENACRVTIDTGFPQLSVPRSVLTALDNVLNVDESCGNYDTLPKLGFVMGGRVFSLGKEEYIAQDSDTCRLALNVIDIPPPTGPMFIFGTPFLQKFTTVYDIGNRLLGFAVANQGENVPLAEMPLLMEELEELPGPQRRNARRGFLRKSW